MKNYNTLQSLDANVQSDVKINMNGADKDKSEAACRRSGVCGPETPKPALSTQEQTAAQPPPVTEDTQQQTPSSTASALQALQQLVNQEKSNGVAKDTATVLVNGVPVKIPLGK